MWLIIFFLFDRDCILLAIPEELNYFILLCLLYRLFLGKTNKTKKNNKGSSVADSPYSGAKCFIMNKGKTP